MENYILYDEIGRGEHSIVYKGRKKGTIEFVAIHCVEKCKRFELRNIVRLTHEMEHSNVVRFHEWYETTNHIWMVVELCTGDSLDAVLSQDKQLPEDTVRRFGAEIAKALFYIHSLGILYCDLKPSRIMLDGAGVLKLSDFALARVEGEDDFYDFLQEERNSGDEDQSYMDREKERGKRPKPSPHYMAPEVLSGGAHSKEADLWSFGCVLYELFTGKQPFLADSFQELVTKIFHESPQRLSFKGDSAANVTLNELDGLIQSLLQKDPTQRLGWDDLITHRFWNGELEHYFETVEESKTGVTEDQQESLVEESTGTHANEKEKEQFPGELTNEPKEREITNHGDLLKEPEQTIRQGTYTFSGKPCAQTVDNEELGKTKTVVRQIKSEEHSISITNSSSKVRQTDVKNSDVETSNQTGSKAKLLKRNQTFNKRDFTGLEQNGSSQTGDQESNTPLMQEAQEQHEGNTKRQKNISDLANHPSDFIATPIADNPKIKKFSLPKWDTKSLPCQPLKPGEVVDLSIDKFEEHLTAIRELLSQSDKTSTGPMAALHRSKLHTSSYLASLCRDGEIANVIFDSDFISVMLKQIKSGFSADYKARLGRHSPHNFTNFIFCSQGSSPARLHGLLISCPNMVHEPP